MMMLIMIMIMIMNLSLLTWHKSVTLFLYVRVSLSVDLVSVGDLPSCFFFKSTSWGEEWTLALEMFSEMLAVSWDDSECSAENWRNIYNIGVDAVMETTGMGKSMQQTVVKRFFCQHGGGYWSFWYNHRSRKISEKSVMQFHMSIHVLDVFNQV